MFCIISSVEMSPPPLDTNLRGWLVKCFLSANLSSESPGWSPPLFQRDRKVDSVVNVSCVGDWY